MTAPDGTVAMISLSAATYGEVAETPPNCTEVAPVKFTPLMLICVPTGPKAGVKPVMTGAPLFVKLLLVVKDPSELLILMGPMPEMVAGGRTCTSVPLFAETVPAMPLNATLAEDRFTPSIVTTVVAFPAVGEKPVMIGPEPVTKLLVVVALPLGVVTLSGPLTAEDGTTTVSWVPEFTVAVAVPPLAPNFTLAGPKKLPPVTTTFVAVAGGGGRKSADRGQRAGCEVLVLTLVPALVTTLIGPSDAPAGTVATASVSAMTEAVTDALVPVKITVVPLVTKLAPKIVTRLFEAPICGEKLVMTGAAKNFAELLTPLAPMKTSSGPLVAPTGTTTCN